MRRRRVGNPWSVGWWGSFTTALGLCRLGGLAGILACAPPAFGQGLEFFVTDAQDKKVYAYDLSGLPIGDFSLDPANSNPAGVVSDGLTVHVLDVTDKKVYRYDTAGALQATSRELGRADGSSLSTPSGLAIDFELEEMWVVDRGRARIFRYFLADVFSTGGRSRANKEVVLAPANGRAVELAMDDVWLYVLDETDRQVYRYSRWGTGTVQASAVMQQEDGSSLRAPAGVTVGLGSLSVVDRSRDKIYEYDRGELFSGFGAVTATSQFALPLANADPRGLHSTDESTTPVALPPEGDERLEGLLKAHNGVRADAKVNGSGKKKDGEFIFPPPKDPKALADLVWKEDLAQIAQKYAGECTTKHSDVLDPTDPKKEKKLGENIAALPELGLADDAKGLAQLARLGLTGGKLQVNVKGVPTTLTGNGWAEEAPNYTGQTEYPSGNNYGHWTQLVWNDTTEVGCGINPKCTENSPIGTSPWVVLVCNYRTAGNVGPGPGGVPPGQQPYVPQGK